MHSFSSSGKQPGALRVHHTTGDLLSAAPSRLLQPAGNGGLRYMQRRRPVLQPDHRCEAGRLGMRAAGAACAGRRAGRTSWDARSLARARAAAQRAHRPDPCACYCPRLCNRAPSLAPPRRPGAAGGAGRGAHGVHRGDGEHAAAGGRGGHRRNPDDWRRHAVGLVWHACCGLWGCASCVLVPFHVGAVILLACTRHACMLLHAQPAAEACPAAGPALPTTRAGAGRGRAR